MSFFYRGKLRHRVTIVALQQVQDPDTGIITEGWADLADVWAAVEPLSGREYLSSQAQQAEITTRITMCWRADVDARMRVRHETQAGTQLYEIHAVLPDPDSGVEWMTLMCSAKADDTATGASP